MRKNTEKKPRTNIKILIKKNKEKDKKSTTFAIAKFEERKIYGEQDREILIILNCIYGKIIPKTIKWYLFKPWTATDIKRVNVVEMPLRRRSSYILQRFSMTKEVQFNELVVNYQGIDKDGSSPRSFDLTHTR